jgi:hypothetical protein
MKVMLVYKANTIMQGQRKSIVNNSSGSRDEDQDFTKGITQLMKGLFWLLAVAG